jgi:hypothetical protein
MAQQSPKPLAARVSGWGATASPDGSRLLMTSAQYAQRRRKRADLIVTAVGIGFGGKEFR